MVGPLFVKFVVGLVPWRRGLTGLVVNPGLNALQFALFLSLILYSLFFLLLQFGALCCSTISTVVNPGLGGTY